MRKTKKTEAEFANLLARLIANYPNTYVGSEAERNTRLVSWFDELRRFDLETIGAAMHAMPDMYPDKLPTSGQVALKCSNIVATRRAEAERAEKGRRADDEERAHLAMLERVPNDREMQKRWIMAAKKPCELAGRKWAAESKRRRAAGEKCPTATVSRMVGEILEAIDATPSRPVDPMYFRKAKI
jgi:hypothetical protein